MRRSKPHVLLLLLFAHLIHSAFAQHTNRNQQRTCAPRSTVEAALGAAEREAAHSLAEAEAGWLVGGLRIRGSPGPNGTICFSRADFAAFGHILATVLSSAEAPSAARFSAFERPKEDTGTLQRSARCACKCAELREPWCGDGAARCCAKYCQSIFSVISVGALAALVRDGVAACCRDASRSCLEPPAQAQNLGARKLVAGPTPTPSIKPPPPNGEFQFRAPGKRSGFELGAGALPIDIQAPFIDVGSSPHESPSPHPVPSAIGIPEKDVAHAVPSPVAPSQSATPVPTATLAPVSAIQGAETGLGSMINDVLPLVGPSRSPTPSASATTSVVDTSPSHGTTEGEGEGEVEVSGRWKEARK